MRGIKIMLACAISRGDMMRRFAVRLVATCLLTSVPCTPALAQGAPSSAQLQLAKQAEKLKPGQWVWKGEIAPKGPILVYVDLGRQLATVYRNGVRVGDGKRNKRDGVRNRDGQWDRIGKRDGHR